ncbi:unnamed protein product (macronuclear) [Paramecium tetraurelia]|uniref:FACT complex subunit n=1 Tax=Paramecium tetraurelia TaxID=5888 RepID=A0E089_PARTE|nr:uncharacterized protein GSPATT00021874001 [Paramecium tetraurelia]CAK88706.1 unnamed protein product [Paramecium tetraurelia]|eukprot:XP_001456103.1 hypothetical protein (macronuclear) [Paramecium tetraurelia strain d4-2]
MDKVQIALQNKFKKNNKLAITTLRKANQFDCLAVLIGTSHTSNIGIQKGFQQWYLGCELMDCILIMSTKMLCIIADEVMFQKLKHLSDIKMKTFTIFFLIKNIKKNNHQQFQFALERLRKEYPGNNYRLALNLSDGQKSPLITEFNQFIDQNHLIKVDCTSFLKELINNDNKDIFEYYNTCGKINSYYMKFMSQRIELAIKFNENTTNYSITQAVKREKSSDLNQMAIRRKFGLQGNYDILSSTVQSGGQYNVSASESTQSRLVGDVVIYSFCCQYMQSQSYCTRTLLFQPNQELEQIYRVILNVHAFALGLVKEDIQFKQIYRETQNIWETIFKDDPEMKMKFPTDIGYLIGSQMLIDNHNIETIQDRMAVVIRMFVDNILVQLPFYPERTNIAICLADTIFVVSGIEDCVITKAEKEFTFVSYQPTEEGERFFKSTFQKNENSDVLHQSEKITREQFEQAELNKIKNDQEKLKEIKQYELEVRLNDQQTRQEPKLLVKMDQLQAFQKEDQFDQYPKGEIAVDQDKSAILIPIIGTHYPFHALTIQNVSVKELPNGAGEITIRFWTNEFHIDTREFPSMDQDQMFLKEITLRNQEFIKLQDIENEINVCRDDARRKQIEKQLEVDKFDFVIEKLTVLPKNTPCLSKVYMRPTQSQKTRSPEGFVECHENGFRYKSARGEVIDFTFTSIKHCFFVSPEDEVIACIHFIFKMPIKCGKIMFSQIQFYRDIEGASEQEAARRKVRLFDIDHVFDKKVQDRRLEELKNFESFIQQSEQYYKRFNIKFERLEKQYSFEGNYAKERVVFQPTQSCLVNIVDQPFFTLTLENVDIMCCERVQEETISFDLVAVLKDLEAQVIRIEAIDREDLKKIQQWLNKKKILFFQTTSGLMWRNMQFSIQKDFPLFVYDGGWATMMKDHMEHAPIQQFNDEPLFEPDSSNGPTSVSEFEFEQDKKNNKYLHLQKDDESDFSDLVDSEDIMSELDIQERRKRKKVKYNFID